MFVCLDNELTRLAIKLYRFETLYLARREERSEDFNCIRFKVCLPYSIEHNFSIGTTAQSFFISLNHIKRAVSGFLRDVYKICALIRYHAAYSGNSLPTFRNNLSVSSSRVRKSKKSKGSALFWDITQRREVIPYISFEYESRNVDNEL